MVPDQHDRLAHGHRGSAQLRARSDGTETYGVRSEEHPGPTAVTTPSAWWIPTIDQVWVFAALALPIIAGLMRMTTIDLAYHIRAGNLILSHGIPRIDAFTFTVAGRPWLDQQWGAQVVLATTYRIGGWPALVLLRAALMLLTFAPVWLACRARGASERAASLLTIAAFVMCLANLGMRPQMLALPLFTTSLWLVLDRRAHPTRLWLVPAMTVAWASLHGSFVLSPALLALVVIEDLWRRDPIARTTTAVAVATLLATVVNPFGVGAWRYAIDIATSPTIRTTLQEWAPTTLRGLTGCLFFVSAAAVVLFLARRKEPTRWFDLVWLGSFALLALPAQRGVVWWALVAPPIMAGLLPRADRSEQARVADRRPLNIVVVASLLALFGLMLPWHSQPTPLTGAAPQLTDAPEHLVEATAQAIPVGGHVFVTEAWGSWFEFALPDRPVFVDPRIEIFPDDVWNDYDEVMSGREGWQGILNRWNVDAVVLRAGDATLRSLIAKDAGWRLAYDDNLGSLFVRA